MDIQPDYVDFSIPVPVTMQASPSIHGIVSNWLDSSWALSCAVKGGSSIRVRAYKQNHGLSGPLSPAEVYRTDRYVRAAGGLTQDIKKPP